MWLWSTQWFSIALDRIAVFSVLHTEPNLPIVEPTKAICDLTKFIQGWLAGDSYA